MIGTADTSARFALDMANLGKLRLQAKQDPNGALKGVAQQFEALFLNMMMKSMRQASPQDGPFDSDQTKLYTELMDQQMTQQLASKKGIGLADLMVKQLTRTQGVPPSQDKAEQPGVKPVSGFNATPLAPAIGRQAASTEMAAPSANTPANTATSAAASGQENRFSRFVNRFWSHAVEAGKELGVSPRFLVGHAALESGWGKREIRGEDGKNSHNLFGIKAGGKWTGDTVSVTTTEYVNGVPQKRQEQFRAYSSYAESFRDYASMLKNNPRYRGALGQGQDAVGFARGLQQGGYATDPMYADKLARIVNGNTLRQALIG